jgi:hypothetical protein
MSKKKFSEGLDDLFSDHQDAKSEVFSAERPPVTRKASNKRFATDLDMLLQEALEESLEKYDAHQPDTTTPSAKSKSQTDAPATRQGIFSGLDALIRQTIDVQEIAADEQSGKKRLTVAVDRNKLEKLKLIARLENAYLKDILIGVIDEYIDDYKQQKGIDL